MNNQINQTNQVNHDETLERALEVLRRRGGDGTAHAPTVDELVKELNMNGKVFVVSKKLMVGLLAATFLTGAAVSAGVYHTLAGRAIVQTSDGRQFEMQVDENGHGEWVGENGQRIQLQTTQDQGGQKQVEVQVEGATSGEVTTTITPDPGK